MFPFGNNFTNQYLAELYSTSANYSQTYLIVPNSSFPYWNPNNINQNHHQQPNPTLPDPHLPPPQQTLVKIEEKNVKTRDAVQNESSLSCQVGDEQSENSPDFKLRQKYGRNINSNIYHHMIKKISTEQYFVQLLKKIIQKQHYSLNEKQFLEMLNRKMGKLRTYVSLKKMRNLFKGGTFRTPQTAQVLLRQKQFYQIYRIVCRTYLKSTHIAHVYNGLKIKNQSKKFHIWGVRKIAELLQL